MLCANGSGLIGRCGALVAMSLLIGCGTQTTGYSRESLCVVLTPFYFSEAEIGILLKNEDLAEKLAAHNRWYEEQCT